MCLEGDGGLGLRVFRACFLGVLGFSLGFEGFSVAKRIERTILFGVFLYRGAQQGMERKMKRTVSFKA